MRMGGGGGANEEGMGNKGSDRTFEGFRLLKYKISFFDPWDSPTSKKVSEYNVSH
jgi:hypothetical protein